MGNAPTFLSTALLTRETDLSLLRFSTNPPCMHGDHLKKGGWERTRTLREKDKFQGKWTSRIKSLLQIFFTSSIKDKCVTCTPNVIKDKLKNRDANFRMRSHGGAAILHDSCSPHSPPFSVLQAQNGTDGPEGSTKIGGGKKKKKGGERRRRRRRRGLSFIHPTHITRERPVTGAGLDF